MSSSLSVKVSLRSRILFPGDDLECTISVLNSNAPLDHETPSESLDESLDDQSLDDASSSSPSSPRSVSSPAAAAAASTSQRGAWRWLSSWFAGAADSDEPAAARVALSADSHSSAPRRPAALLDYVTVQVVGKYIADSSWVQLSPAFAQQPCDRDGSRLLFESAPCTLAEGVDSCLVRYTLQLPRKIPPTFKGVAIKYFYTIRVVARLRRPDSAERVVTIPFRVINPLGNVAVIHLAPRPVLNVEPQLHDLQPFEANSRQAVQLTDTIAHAASAVELMGSPLVRARQRAPTIAKPAAAALDDSADAAALTSPQLRVASLSSYYRRLQREQQTQNVQNNVKALYGKLSRPLSIEISRTRRHVAQFTINRTAFQLGDVIVGNFDFSRATTACYQVLCSLDFDEAVAVDMQPPTQPPDAWHTLPTLESDLTPHASVGPAAVPARYAGSTTLRKTVAEAHMITVHTVRTGFSLAIPPQAPYSFSTSHVRVSWTLRFVFAIAARSQADDGQAALDASHLAAPAVDCLHWELPIQVLVPEKPAEFLFERDAERIAL
jgi:hypothetical protein